MNTNFRVLIPAGGRGLRSGLNYPKTLYKIDNIPILIRLCRVLKEYDKNPLIIINPSNKIQFEKALMEFKIEAELVYQNEPRGMGHAVLQADDRLKENNQVILVWSDIPFLNPFTIENLINCHNLFENDFSMATSKCEECYTIVERSHGKLLRVIETRAEKIPPGKNGERDIGLFIFNKESVFSLLRADIKKSISKKNKEYGFLHIIEKLIASGKKAEAYPIAHSSDLLSFNTPEDLKQIENSFGLTTRDK